MGKRKSVQSLCLAYLARVRAMAEAHGVRHVVDDMESQSADGRCVPTEDDVRLLARLAGDERLHRKDVSRVMGKSYRKCVEDGDFEKIRTLPRVGIYDKVSALLHKMEDEDKDSDETERTGSV